MNRVTALIHLALLTENKPMSGYDLDRHFAKVGIKTTHQGIYREIKRDDLLKATSSPQLDRALPSKRQVHWWKTLPSDGYTPDLTNVPAHEVIATGNLLAVRRKMEALREEFKMLKASDTNGAVYRKQISALSSDIQLLESVLPQHLYDVKVETYVHGSGRELDVFPVCDPSMLKLQIDYNRTKRIPLVIIRPHDIEDMGFIKAFKKARAVAEAIHTFYGTTPAIIEGYEVIAGTLVPETYETLIARHVEQYISIAA